VAPKNLDFLPLVISLSLIFTLGTGMDRLLTASGREHFPVVRVESIEGIDQSYSGLYSQDPEFMALVEELAAVRAQAIRRAEARLGLEFDRPEFIIVRLEDTSANSGLGASSRPVRARQGDVFLVTLSARQLRLGVMDVESSLVHEFIHGLMREKMGERDYLSLPVWIREGIAVWGAGQLRERARNVISEAFLEGKDPRIVVSELENLRFSSDEYLTDAILFELIEKESGAEAVRRAVRSLVEGDSWREVLEEASAMSWSVLQMAAMDFSSVLFERMVSESGLGLFQTARRLERLGDTQAALEKLFALVEVCPDELLKPSAWYWIGRWSERLGDLESAAGAYDTVLQDYPGQIGLQDDCRLRLAGCLVRLGELGRAHRELLRFVKVHTGAPRWMRGDASYLLACIDFQRGDYSRAIDLLRAALWDGVTSREETLALLCLAHLERGDAFESKLTYFELAYRFPDSQHLGQLEGRLRLASGNF